MASHRSTRWVICALALAVMVPVAVADRSKSISDCTYFDQQDKDDDKVEFTVKNLCSVPVDCSMSWRVVCAPDSKKRRSVHPASAKFALESGAVNSKEASAGVCGDDGWAIDSIKWSCEPNKE
jgi:hypothetical protein